MTAPGTCSCPGLSACLAGVGGAKTLVIKKKIVGGKKNACFARQVMLKTCVPEMSIRNEGLEIMDQGCDTSKCDTLKCRKPEDSAESIEQHTFISLVACADESLRPLVLIFVYSSTLLCVSLRSYSHFTSSTPSVSLRGRLSKTHRFSLSNIQTIVSTQPNFLSL